MKTLKFFSICLAIYAGAFSWNEALASDKDKKTAQAALKEKLFDSQTLDSIATSLIEEYLQFIEEAGPANPAVVIYSIDGELLFEGRVCDAPGTLLNCEYLFESRSTAYYLARQ